MRHQLRALLSSTALLATIAAAGCSGGSSSPTLPSNPSTPFPVSSNAATPTPTPSSMPTMAPASLSMVATVVPGASVAFPSLGGYTASVAFPTSGVPAGTKVTVSAFAAAPAGAPLTLSAQKRIAAALGRAPASIASGAALIAPYLTVGFTSSFTLPQTLAFSVTLPPSVPTAGLSFFGSAIDITNPSAPVVVFLVPGTVASSTLSFPATTESGVTFVAGDTYLLGIFSEPTPVGTALAETPLAADALADSIGINTKLPTYVGASDFATLAADVKTLGIRHVRDAIIDANAAYDTAMTQMLAGGAKLDGITDCPGIAYYSGSATSASQIQAFQSAIGGGLEMVEGPNEIDTRGDASYVNDTVSCLPSLRGALPLPFLAPSLADPLDHAPALGNIASLVDIGNIHRFYAGRNPGTSGFGGSTSCGTYGALPWALCEAAINAPGKPAMVTEAGYNSQSEVDEATQAKYLSRMFLVNLQAGIPKTYVYVFKDYSGSDGFGGDGLIRTDDSLKPSYTAIQNELSFFSDPGAASLTKLSYSLSTTGVDHELFEKHDGTYVLALWNETASWNPSTNAAIPVASQAVSVTLPSLSTTPTAVALNDAGALVAAPLTTAGSAITASIDDHVTLISFKL